MRVTAEGGGRQSHPLQQRVHRPGPFTIVGADAVDAHRLEQDLADREARIERGVGVLEDDLDAPFIGRVFALRHGQQVAPLEQHAAAGGPVQAQQGQADRGLARARFPDHAQRLAARERERDILHGAELALAEQPLAQPEAFLQVLHDQHILVAGRIAARALRHDDLLLSLPAQEIVDHRQPQRTLVQLRPAVQQRLGVAVARRAEHLDGAALLAHFAMAHHDHAVGDLGHQPQVVGNEQHRHAVLLLQRGDQLHDLLLDRHVERRGRLVGDQELGFAGNSHGDHDTLLLPARHLARVGVDLGAGVGNADLFQQGQGAGARLPLAHAHVQAQHLADLEADREHRIERGHRLLEDHGDVLAAQRAARGDRQLQQLAPLEAHARIRIHERRVRRQQAHHRQRADRLAAARFSDQRHGGIAGHVEGNALDRFDCVFLVDTEGDAQIAYLQQHGRVWRILLVHRGLTSISDRAHRAMRR